jgi:uncharacterized protein involved in outer membrane biogenesis
VTLNNIVKLLSFLLLVCLGLFFIPSFVSFDYLKTDLDKKFAQESNLNVKILGKIHASVFPQSSITINQVRLDLDETTKIEIPKLTLNISMLSFLTANIDIKSMEITGAQFTVDSVKKLSDLFYKSNTPKNQLFRSFGLNNVNLVLDPNSKSFNKLADISGKLIYHPDRSLEFSGKFNLNSISYNLKLNLFTNKEIGSNASIVYLANDFTELKFKGDLTTKDSNYDLIGNASIKFFDNLKGRDEVSFIQQALLQDEIKANSNIHLNKEHIVIDNFTLSSNSINKITGKFNLSLAGTHEISSSFEGDSINLDKITSNTPANQNSILSFEDFMKDFLMAFNFDVPNNLTGKIDFTLKELIVNSQPIRDVTINSSILEEKFILSELIMYLPGKSTLEFTGTMSHNEVRPKFDGKFSLKVENYLEFSSWLNFNHEELALFANQPLNINSGISIIPRNFRVDNAKLEWGDLKAFGKFIFRHTGEKQLNTQANIRINHIDGDSMKLPEDLNNFLANLYASDFEKTGSKFYEITNDFKWLRAFPVDLDLNLLIDKFKYRDIEFPNFYSSLSISPNNLRLNQLMLQSDDSSITGSASLITSAIAPKVQTDIVVNYITSEFIERIAPPYELLTTKQAELVSKNPDIMQTVTIGGANFYGIHNISGDFKLLVKDYKSPSLSLQNLNLSAQAQEGIITIDNLSADLFQGKLQLAGNIVTTTTIPTYSATFALNNFQLVDFLKSYADYDKLDGYLSASGSFAAKGASYDAFYASSIGALNILGKKVIWNNFDVGEIIRLSEYVSPYADKVEKLQYYINNGQSSFDDLEGAITIQGGIAAFDNFKFKNTRISGAFAAKADIKNRLISSFARINFIPYGRAATMTIDIAGSGAINNLNPTVNYADYLSFLKDNVATESNPEPISPLLRNQ